MEKEQLKQLRFLYHEVDMIQEQINNLQRECAIVSTSDSEWPYCKHAVKIEGLPRQEDQLKQHKLEKRKKECRKKIKQLEYYIQHVDDSLIRQLLTYRYMEGLKWNDIAAKMGSGYSEDSLRKMLERFLNKS
jgi:hypothetical protein